MHDRVPNTGLPRNVISCRCVVELEAAPAAGPAAGRDCIPVQAAPSVVTCSGKRIPVSQAALAAASKEDVCVCVRVCGFWGGGGGDA